MTEPLKPVKPTISANRKLIELTVDEMSKVAIAFARSQTFKSNREPMTAEACFVVILAGQELGLGPSQAMMGIKMIEGKPELSANTMAALVKAGGKYDFRVEYGPGGSEEDTWCEIAFFLVDGGESVGVSRFSMTDAIDAGLWKNNYLKYWRNMLFARALSNGVKWYCADALRVSAYHEGEIEGDTDAPPPQIAAPAAQIEASPEPVREPAVVQSGPQQPYDPPDEEPEEEVQPGEVDYFNPDAEMLTVPPVVPPFAAETETTSSSMFDPTPIPQGMPPTVENVDSPNVISAAQVKLYHVKRKQAGFVNENDPNLRALVKAITGVDHVDRIPKSKFSDLLKHFDNMKGTA